MKFYILNTQSDNHELLSWINKIQLNTVGSLVNSKIIISMKNVLILGYIIYKKYI